jgi:hypothetical protein
MAVERMMPYTARTMQVPEGAPQHERHDGVVDMPEYRLLEALLSEAVNTYVYGDENKRHWVEARRWLTRPEQPNSSLYHDGITLQFVCSHLGLDASYIRKRAFEERIRNKSVDTPLEVAV